MRKGSKNASGAAEPTVLTRKPTPLTRTRTGLRMRKGSKNPLLSLRGYVHVTWLTRSRTGLGMCKGSKEWAKISLQLTAVKMESEKC